MTENETVMLKRFGRGRRVLFASEEAYKVFSGRLMDDQVLKIFSSGSNRFSDKPEWPFYIYVTQKADDSPMNSDDIEYLNGLIDIIDGQGKDFIDHKLESSVKTKSESWKKPSTPDKGNMAPDDLSIRIGAGKTKPGSFIGLCPYCGKEALLSRNGLGAYPWSCEGCSGITPVIKASVEATDNADSGAVRPPALELTESADLPPPQTSNNTDSDLHNAVGEIASKVTELQNSVDKVSIQFTSQIESVSARLNTQVQHILIGELRKFVDQMRDDDGSKQSAEELMRQLELREKDLIDREQAISAGAMQVRHLKDEVCGLRDQNQQQQVYIGDLEHRIEDIKCDELNPSGEQSVPKLSSSWDEIITLMRTLHRAECAGAFFIHLEDRCPSSVSMKYLSEAVQQLVKGGGKRKSLTGAPFSEVQCNLGNGHGTGRLYFDKKGDRYRLLGFGDDKNRQKQDIRQIVEALK